MIRDARQRTRSRKGALLTLLLFGLSLFIFFLDDIVTLFDRRYTIVAVMQSAPRLVPGSPVWIGGKRVGMVKRVGFLPADGDTTNNVAVTLDLPRRHRAQVRADSRVRITSVRRISEPAVDVVPGSNSATILADGDTLPMEADGPSFSELARRAGVVRGELDTTLVEVRKIMPAVNARLEQLRGTFAAFETSMAETRRLRRALTAGTGIAQLSSPAFSASLKRTRAHATELSALIASARARYTTGEMRAAMNGLQQRADSLRTQLDAIAFESGFFVRARSDSALARAIAATRVELDSLIAQTKRNPLRFFF